jgi:hypothetical protein
MSDERFAEQVIELARGAEYKFTFDQAVLRQLEAQNRRTLYRLRPEVWALDVLGVTLWSGQVKICHSVVEHHNTMVAAGHSVGKSMLTAVLICWWIDTHPLGEARVLTTAPTTAQVRGIVWREVQLLHQKSRERFREYQDALKRGDDTTGLPDHQLPGYVTSGAVWRSHDGLELGAGRTPPRGREGDAFQGIHGGVLAIADEAVGVSGAMIGTLRNNTTAEDDRILMIANPTNPASEMGQIWNDPQRAAQWNRISISVLDSPNFTDERFELPENVLKYLASERYVDDMRQEYGEDSANYKSRVKGEWALDTGFILFQEEVLQAAIATTVVPDESDEMHIGFDVARSEKGDWSYLYTAEQGWVYETMDWRDGEDGMNYYPLPEPRKTGRRGIRLRYLDRWRGLPFFPIHNSQGQRQESMAANERVQMHVNELEATQVRIDADGMGALMHDALVDVSDDSYHLIRMRSNDQSPDRNAWYNTRAYWYSSLADRMRRGEVDIEADDIEGNHPLVSQLGGIEYKFATGTTESMLILSKKEMRSKGIKSPDAADAANYAAAWIDVESMLGLQPGDKFQLDFDTVMSGDLYSANSFWG